MVSFHSDGNRISDGRVDNSRRMCHNTAAFHVPKEIDKSPNRPLHHRRSGEGQEAHGWSNHLAPAWVAPCPTLDTHRKVPSNHLDVAGDGKKKKRKNYRRVVC